MEQLTSIDAAFVQAETPSLPMHITTISIYDPTTAPQSLVRFKDIMGLYEEAQYDVPLLRRRLVEVPGNLDFPYWIEDPDFDIEFHVRHIALPQPGDWRQFYIQVARLHSRGVDLSRPLWEVYVIEGLNQLDGVPAGSFAVVQKLHHAAMDGASVRKMFMAMHTFAPEPPAPPKRENRPLIREQRPNPVPLLLKSYRNALGRPAKLGKTALKAVQGMRKVSAAKKSGEISADDPSPPKSRFNGEVGAHRVVSVARFDLDEFKKLRYAQPGATVNDLAITVLGGAIRKYLEAKGDDVSEALVAQVPVNIRAEAQQAEDGNKITTINVSCGSDIADPLERLQAVGASSDTGKKKLAVMGENFLQDMADALGPAISKGILSAMENASKVEALGNLMPGGPNFIFSNLPGPPVPVYLCGAKLVWGIGLGPMMPSMGLFITGTSTLDKFVFGVTACREMMPDPEFFQECIYASYGDCRASLQKLAARNNPASAVAKKNATESQPAKRKAATAKKKAPARKKAAGKKAPAAQRKKPAASSKKTTPKKT